MRAYKCDLCGDYMDVPAEQGEPVEVVASDVGGKDDKKISFRMSLMQPDEAKKLGDYCADCMKKIAGNAIAKVKGLV